MYGKFIETLGKKDDKYGFVNEYEIRISTGLALIFGIYSFISIVFFANFTFSIFAIGIIWLDFLLKTTISPSLSIFGFLAKPFVKNNTYWVGAVQKRFAWSFGLFLSTFVFLCVLIISGTFNDLGIMTQAYQDFSLLPVITPMAIPMNPAIIACVLCIVFMTLESVFGYCVGCKIYQKLVQKNIIKEMDGQCCPGGVCKID